MQEKETTKKIWALEKSPNEVPNHNQISMNWINGENHMGKTLLQKEIAVKRRKDSPLRPPKENFLHPKNRIEMKIP